MTFDYNAIAMELSAADAAISELSGLSRFVPNPHLLIAPYVRQEAVASSRIEGTQADLDELLFDELAPEQRRSGSDVLEIRNYIAALEYGTAQLNTTPLVGRLLRGMHHILLTGVGGQERMPGEFRRTQNWIRGFGPVDALYVPPPPDQLQEHIANWERFVNAAGQMPSLVQCAIAHEYLETIHPFWDGNGRIGRLMITLFLIQRKRLDKPLLYLSRAIEETRHLYYDRLQSVRTRGDRVEWVRYFLLAVETSARRAIQQTDRLLNLRESFRSLPGLSGQHRAKALIDCLFVNPYINIARTRTLLGISKATASKTIAQLDALGLITEITGKTWGRFWRADPILQAIHDDQSPSNDPRNADVPPLP